MEQLTPNSNLSNIPLARYPYRGIVSELATEFKISRSAIQNAIRKQTNPQILSRFCDMVEIRTSEDAKLRKRLERVVAGATRSPSPRQKP